MSTSLTTYDSRHNTLSARLRKAMREGQPCCLCGQPMYRDPTRLGLGIALCHDDTDPARKTVSGLGHQSCNASEAARLGNSMRRPTLTQRSRDW